MPTIQCNKNNHFDYYINCMFKENFSLYLNKIKNIYDYDKINKLLTNFFRIENVEYYNFNEFKKNKLEIYRKISLFLNIKFVEKNYYFKSSINISEKTKEGFYLLNKDNIIKIITNNIAYKIFIRRFFNKKIRQKLKNILLNSLNKKVSINVKQISIIKNYYKNQYR